MRIGNMDRRIDIQSDTPVQDGVGQPVPSWGAVDTVWAAVKEQGRESFEADQHHATRTIEFRIRYRTDLDEKMRIIYPSGGSDIYDIESIIEISRQEGMFITATASVPA